MYAIAGNHDSAVRKGAIPPQVIFKKMGLKVISPINTNYMHGDVFIAGLPFYPASKSNVLKSKLVDLSKKAAEHEKSILVLHQGIDTYLNIQYELEIGDIPDNFNYYALGHIHKYIASDFGKGKLVYPGSAEIWKTDELKDYHENGKGFVVVDLDGPKPQIKRVKIDIPRVFIERSLDYNNLDSGIAGIKETIKDYDKQPILKLNINNVDSDTGYVYDMIKEELGDLSLMIRPTFNMVGEESIKRVAFEKFLSYLFPLNLVRILPYIYEFLPLYKLRELVGLSVSELIPSLMKLKKKLLNQKIFK